MKASKTESQKKTSKKAEKKALEQHLVAKLYEALKSFGHDAEKIGEDLVLVSKFVAKKISKRMKSTKQESLKPPKTKKAEAVKSKVIKSPGSSNHTEPKDEVVLKKSAIKPEAVASSIKVSVAPIEAKEETIKAVKPGVKSNKRAKVAAKPSKPNTNPEKEHIN